MGKRSIVIIGGGIAGLSAGIHGLLEGFDVSIYEKNAVMGGECTGWDRDGYHIDNCIHWLMGAKKGTKLNELWRKVGALDNSVDILEFDKMYTSKLNGKQLTLWKDCEHTRRDMIELSPEDTTEINNLMDSCKLAQHIEIPCEKPPEKFTAIDGIKMASKMKNMLKLMKIYNGMSISELTDKFKHPLIKTVITDFVTRDAMAQSFALAYGNFISGDGGLPKGGSRAFALRMADKFNALGGKAYTSMPVAKINVSNKKADSISLENGETVSADWIICACDPDYTFNTLLSPQYMDDIFKEIYTNRSAYPIYGMFHVAFALASSSDLLNGDIIMDCSDIISRVANRDLAKHMNDRLTVKCYSYEPSFAPKDNQVIQAFCGFDEAAYDIWAKLYSDKSKYNEIKYQIAGEILNKLIAIYPEYENRLKIIDVWTPMTYKRWCNAYKGYNQACVITKNSIKNPYPSARLKGLDNVLIANQWLSAPGGLPGAVIQGKYAIMRIKD